MLFFSASSGRSFCAAFIAFTNLRRQWVQQLADGSEVHLHTYNSRSQTEVMVLQYCFGTDPSGDVSLLQTFFHRHWRKHRYGILLPQKMRGETPNADKLHLSAGGIQNLTVPEVLLLEGRKWLVLHVEDLSDLLPVFRHVFFWKNTDNLKYLQSSVSQQTSRSGTTAWKSYQRNNSPR